MKILAIETSCDDTCIAILGVFSKKKPQFKILSNIISSQVEIHKKWGGVYPSLAKREHQNNLVPVLKEALNKAKILEKSKDVLNKKKTEVLEKILERERRLFKNLIKFLNSYKKPVIDAIAVTIGPGLEPCLWAGINLAKSLSVLWSLPLIPVNHIEAHIFANWIEVFGKNKNIKFPAICLVASGGHTQLILMKKIRSYKILGETRDDAAGECLDKAARILGIGYPGGPIIAVKAAKFKTSKLQICPVKSAGGGARQFNRVKLPRPMIKTKDYDFSFSGLKTAVLYDFKKRSVKIRRSKLYIQEMCFEIQQAVIDVLIKKTKKAAKDHKAKTIILGGGVTANKELRKQFKKDVINKILNTRYFAPITKYCTDNAVMVGVTAYFHYLRGEKMGWREIRANANLSIN